MLHTFGMNLKVWYLLYFLRVSLSGAFEVLCRKACVINYLGSQRKIVISGLGRDKTWGRPWPRPWGKPWGRPWPTGG